MVLAQQRQSETWRRLMVALVLLPLVLAVLSGPSQFFAALAIGAACVCVYELLTLFLASPAPSPLLEMAAAAYLVLAMKAIISLRYQHGRGAIILIFAIAFVGDTAAYLGGRRYGCNLLAPSISAGKTWEGAWFGLAGSVLGAAAVAALGIFGSVSIMAAAGLGFIGGIAGQCGDLLESRYKRQRGVKDSSHLLGAHGGMLDRIDALMAVSLVVWLTLKVILG